MRKSICIISLSNIARDGRVLRQIDYISNVYDVTVIGYGPAPIQYRNKTNIKWYEVFNPRNSIIRIIYTIVSRLILIPFFPQFHPVHKIILECHCDGYLVNNWDSIPFAAIAATKNNGKLVLDIHESYDSWYWGITSEIIKYVFRKYSSYVHASTTVVKQLAEQHQIFGLTPIVLLNAPAIPNLSFSYHPVNPEKIHLIHHGIASHTRRPDLMIKTIAECDKRYDLTLVFINPSSKYVAKLKKLAAQLAPGRVTFLQPFSPSEIVQKISSYDIGFYPIPPVNYNCLISLPNKFFEFIAAGLAVCIGPSPSMSEIVNQYHCGVVASSFEPSNIAHRLNQTSDEQWDEMKRASLRAARVLNADNEMEKVITIYKELFS